MSFGVGISDVITLTKLASDTIHDCRCAPTNFAEASRVVQSLHLMLGGVKKEFENPDSPLYKDDRSGTDFAIHFKNCETALTPLANLIQRYKSLSSTSVRVIDRFRFPKKEYLEHRGNLAFYTSRLGDFLHVIGLGSLGRIEQKIEDIKGHLPDLMQKLDQMCAESRILGDRESVLSDHADDEKFVWKTFRRKLNDAGFTSDVLRQHESALFLRIRELTQCGLLESDEAGFSHVDEEQTDSSHTIYRLPFRSETIPEAVASFSESEETLTDKPLIEDLPYDKPQRSIGSLSRSVSEPSHQRQKDLVSDDRGSSKTLSFQSNADPVEASAPSSKGAPYSPRIWRNRRDLPVVQGTFSDVIMRNRHKYIIIITSDEQEVCIPVADLADTDLAFVENLEKRHATVSTGSEISCENTLPSAASTSQKQDIQDSREEPIDRQQRSRPQILVGQRSKVDIKWSFRETNFAPPDVGPTPPRSNLTCDLLPQAASKGHLKRVKILLAAGEHIESKGPISWTETVTICNGEGGTDTKYIRHSFPETTALFRAASAGWLDIVHYLLRAGAKVNTRDGWDGSVGEPILFKVIKNGHERIARCLLEYGAKMEAWGPKTALHVASSYPKVNLVRLVLDYGAKIDAKDRSTQTPLYLASVAGFASIVQLLLREGAHTNILTSNGQTALYKAGGKGRDDIVELLLRYGADPGLGYGRLGETLIYKAAWYNEIEVLDLLLTFGVDVNQQNREKMERYQSPTEKIIHGVMAGLSKDHALMNAWGKTALHAAAYRGHKEIVELLLEARAEMEVRGNDGVTPLYVAAQQKHMSIVQLLLKEGAQLETERHDPVLALINDRNKAKDGRSREVIWREAQRKEMAKMGTSDALVNLVAGITKNLVASRRLSDTTNSRRS